VRFCSRCGFQLDVVRELLATDGAISWTAAGPPKSGRSPRNKGIRQGVMLMLLTALIVPVAALLSKVGLLPRDFIALAAILCSVGGFLRLVYAIMLEDGPQGEKQSVSAHATPAHLHGAKTPSALPPQQSRPASDFGEQRAGTVQRAQPPSVTENTTRLLDRADED